MRFGVFCLCLERLGKEKHPLGKQMQGTLWSIVKVANFSDSREYIQYETIFCILRKEKRLQKISCNVHLSHEYLNSTRVG